MEIRTSRPLLDLVGAGELARALRERGDGGWEPEVPEGEGGRRRISMRRLLKVLPWVMLPLGLLAVAGLVAAVRAMAGGDSPDGVSGWLRFGLLVVSVAFIGSQVWRLVSKTGLARRVRSRFEPKKARSAVPVLDATPLGVLRGAVPEGWGEPDRRAVAEARTRRFAGSASWWVLVALALLLSAGIVALMVGLAAWELADGREAGPWLVLPLFAGGFAALGFWMSLRTALRSRTDLRQRRRGRLFRRVLGYIARGPGGGGQGGRSGSLAANSGGAPGLASNVGGGVGQVFAAGGLVAGSVAVSAGHALGSLPGRLSKVDVPGTPVGGLGFAGFAVASVAMAWAGFGWPGGGADGVGEGAPLVSSVETPTVEASVTVDAGGETPEPGDDDDLPLAAGETATATPSTGEVLATMTPPGGGGGAGDDFSSGTNPPAGATPAGGGLSTGQGAAPATPTSTATATNTPVTPTATATATRTPTPVVDPAPPPPPSPTAKDPTVTPPTREPDPPATRTPTPVKKPTLTPTPKPGGPPNSAIPTPTPTKIGGFSIGGGGSN